MQAYETFATVQGQGEVRVVGVPFAPGTEVEVAISPKVQTTATGFDVSPDRLGRLLAALDKSRNLAPIGPLRRDELYDRDGLH
jgi:hypothetical protein